MRKWLRFINMARFVHLAISNYVDSWGWPVMMRWNRTWQGWDSRVNRVTPKDAEGPLESKIPVGGIQPRDGLGLLFVFGLTLVSPMLFDFVAITFNQ